MKPPSKLMLGLFAALAILLVGAVVVQPRLQPHVFHGSVLQGGDPVDDFTLTAQTGQPVSLSDFRGKYVVLYFGYTSCPDICPLTLAQLSQAMRLLGNKAQDVQVIMVTVDPERDTPQRLASYLTAFSPPWSPSSVSPAPWTRYARSPHRWASCSRSTMSRDRRVT